MHATWRRLGNEQDPPAIAAGARTKRCAERQRELQVFGEWASQRQIVFEVQIESRQVLEVNSSNRCRQTMLHDLRKQREITVFVVRQGLEGDFGIESGTAQRLCCR